MLYCLSIDAHAHIELTVDTAMQVVFIIEQCLQVIQKDTRCRPVSILNYQGLSI